MARRLRIQYPGALYHVINRGNYRSPVFGTAGAAHAFVTALGEVCSRYSWRLHAYVVMPNHYHLALETPEPNLVDGMHWLQTTFASRFNRFREENGHVFQGRYKAPVVEDSAAMARVIHYIHLNPVRSGLVAFDQAASFRWSSLRALSRGERPSWLWADLLLGELGIHDNSAGWTRYLAFLSELAVNSAEQARLGFPEFSRQWAIGTAGWKQALGRDLHRLALAPGYEAAEICELKRQRWSGLLEHALRETGKTQCDVNEGPNDASWKIQVAARLRRDAVPYRWISESLKMDAPGIIRGLVFRHREQRTA